MSIVYNKSTLNRTQIIMILSKGEYSLNITKIYRDPEKNYI